MIEGELRHRQRVRHTSTGGIYLVSGPCKMKMEDGTWVSGIIYSPQFDLETVYVREEREFCEKFERVPS